MRTAQAEYFQGVHGARTNSDHIFDVEYRQAFVQVELLLRVFAELGRPINRGDTILDFGCGEGRMVHAFRKLGHKAFGADIAPPSPEMESLLWQDRLSDTEEKPLRTSPVSPYRIPFDDDHFDFVFSWDVMEHVQDHEQAISEIRRVLKPCGRSLHFFPARYRFLEPHVHVPFGTLLQGHGYLYWWALLGVRTKSQKGLPAREVARKNYEFLKTETKYLTKRGLTQLVRGYFGNIDFVERHFWKHNGGTGGSIYRTLSRLGLRKATPLAATVLSPFGRRALFFFKPPSRPGLTPSCGYRSH